jgi:hypothetical protein
MSRADRHARNIAQLERAVADEEILQFQTADARTGTVLWRFPRRLTINYYPSTGRVVIGNRDPVMLTVPQVIELVQKAMRGKVCGGRRRRRRRRPAPVRRSSLDL